MKRQLSVLLFVAPLLIAQAAFAWTPQNLFEPEAEIGDGRMAKGCYPALVSEQKGEEQKKSQETEEEPDCE